MCAHAHTDGVIGRVCVFFFQLCGHWDFSISMWQFRAKKGHKPIYRHIVVQQAVSHTQDSGCIWFNLWPVVVVVCQTLRFVFICFKSDVFPMKLLVISVIGIILALSAYFRRTFRTISELWSLMHSRLSHRGYNFICTTILCVCKVWELLQSLYSRHWIMGNAYKCFAQYRTIKRCPFNTHDSSNAPIPLPVISKDVTPWENPHNTARTDQNVHAHADLQYTTTNATHSDRHTR